MGKLIGTVAGAVGLDSAIDRGVEEGQAGYGQAISSYSAAKDEALGFLQSYRQAGEGATDSLTAHLTGRRYDPDTGEYTDLSPEERFASFQESPGYQFRMDQGLKGVQNVLAAQGKSALGGRGLTELTQRGQGLASSEYQNYINNLMGLSGIGQTSAGQSANIAYGTGQLQGGAQIGIGNLGMQGTIARGQNFADTAGIVGTEADKAGLAAFLSDITLKENIEKIGNSQSGIPIYNFEYKDKKYGQFRYEGVMAQDLLELKPEAVSKKDGYLIVDYDKIDVNFRRI